MLKLKPKNLFLLLFVSLFAFATAVDHVTFNLTKNNTIKGGADIIFSNGFEVPGLPIVNYNSDTVAEITDIPNIETGSHLVGSIGGSFQADQMGQANYSIPLLTGAGTAGLAPQMSLNYSSGSGNGVAGVGWSLSGTTIILPKN